LRTLPFRSGRSALHLFSSGRSALHLFFFQGPFGTGFLQRPFGAVLFVVAVRHHIFLVGAVRHYTFSQGPFGTASFSWWPFGITSFRSGRSSLTRPFGTDNLFFDFDFDFDFDTFHFPSSQCLSKRARHP
jgi:hypothetical protein